MVLIRKIISAFLIIEITFCSVNSGGISVFNYQMPDLTTSEYSQYVNPFIGTGGIPWASGMLSPAATVPFGLVRLGPDTSSINGLYLFKTNTSGYYYEHRHILGFSYSRLSGTGIRDYGMFRVTPNLGSSNSKEPNAYVFSHDKEIASPGYYGVYLPGASVLCEMTATEHTGFQRYTFNSSKNAGIYIDASSTLSNCTTKDSVIKYDSKLNVITAETTILGEFSERYEGIKVYYYAECDTEIKKFSINNENNLMYLEFGNVKNKPITLKAGISFVSTENARNNLLFESKDLSFDEIRLKADELWNTRLSTIQIDATDNIKVIFYTSLYHAMIMPTDFTDYNGEYIGFDKQVHNAEGFTYRTDMSLWDTCRNVNSLYTLIADDIENDCINSLINMADLGGVLPRWPMGEGYTGSMLGCPANIIFSECYLKGYIFDIEKVYSYMKKSAETFNNKENREYADLYDNYGFVPDDIVRDQYRGLSVSRTLEYSWADSVIAMFADILGKQNDFGKYSKRAQNYKNIWNDKTKYFQARNSDGSWGVLKPRMTAFYDDIFGLKYSKAYCEGSARQWRFSALNDIKGMIELFGSNEYFVNELDDFMKDASLKRAALNPGDGYWIGNQHDIHTAYLFNYAGRPDLTQKWVRWTLKNRFSNDIDGIDGNDDGGTLSSWYIFSSLGFYPIAGTDKYQIGSPIINNALITFSNGNKLQITVKNQSEENIYVKSIFINGKKLNGTELTHNQLISGGEIIFEMSNSIQYNNHKN